MSLDEVIERILAVRPDLTREEVERLIRERASRAGAISMLSAALELSLIHI